MVCFLLLEELLLLYLLCLFFGYKVMGYCVFCVLCDSDFEVEDEVEDLVCEFEVVLKCCCCGEVVCMKIIVNVFVVLWVMIMEELLVLEEEVVEVDGMIGMVNFKELVLDEWFDLFWLFYVLCVLECV